MDRTFKKKFESTFVQNRGHLQSTLDRLCKVTHHCSDDMNDDDLENQEVWVEVDGTDFEDIVLTINRNRFDDMPLQEAFDLRTLVALARKAKL